MVDPRIYRAGLVLVAIGVIVFGFSLQAQPGPDTTAVAPPAYTAPSLKTLVAQRRRPRFVSWVEGQLDSAVTANGPSGFIVTNTDVSAQTALGAREVPIVTAARAGVAGGAIVVVSDRDAPGEAGVASTAILIALAHAFALETQSHPIELVSIGAPVGAAGAAALARSLAASSQPVDAVIVLGDVAALHPSEPVVVPFSDSQALAPPVLRATVDHYVTATTGLGGGGENFGAQLAHLAFPLAMTDQGPFAAREIPAVLVSLSGDRLPAPGEAVYDLRLGQVFAAVVQSLDALDAAPPVPPPSSYLVLSGKLVPVWALRLLVLVLIVPVGMTTVDALARVRRRGHSVARWLVWTLAGAVPFLLAGAVIVLARLAGLIPAAPPELTGPHAVPFTARAGVAIGLAATAWVVAYAALRPLCLRLALEHLGSERRPSTPAGDAAGVALSIVMCLTALAAWVLNPFAAVLLVPALHLWMWLAQTEVRARRWLVALLLLLGALPVLAVIVYFAHSFGLTSPPALAWSAVLLLAGGGVPASAFLYWSVALGCFLGATIIGVRASRGAAALTRVEPAVTVRGPVGYAGPGSLGGTKSALRR
jgi:hypothetical protein